MGTLNGNDYKEDPPRLNNMVKTEQCCQDWTMFDDDDDDDEEDDDEEDDDEDDDVHRCPVLQWFH